ncbi:YajG family lipoprotein [Thalassotalea euphylliae]|nr:YajG family lipoprotein [Thalassotalea euphylliae]
MSYFSAISSVITHCFSMSSLPNAKASKAARNSSKAVKTNSYRTILSVSFVTLLGACATPPSQVIVAPQISQAAMPIYSGNNISLAVVDLRPSNHLIQILRKDKPAELFSPAQSLSDSLSASLSQYLNAQGLSTQGGVTQMKVSIEKALVSVQQSMVKYQASSEIRLLVNINKGDKTYSQVLTSKGNSNGPIKADIAVLERDLNQQLGKVISELANNPELIAFMQNN